MAAAVRDALQGARAGLAKLREAAAAMGEGGELKDEAKLMQQEAAALLDALERKVCSMGTDTGRMQHMRAHARYACVAAMDEVLQSLYMSVSLNAL